jgi:hypothetical protein
MDAPAEGAEGGQIAEVVAEAAGRAKGRGPLPDDRALVRVDGGKQFHGLAPGVTSPVAARCVSASAD